MNAVVPVSKLIIGAVTYEIREEQHLYNQEGRQLYGETEHAKLIIRVDPDLPLPRIRQTLVHELLHSLDTEYHTGIGDNEDLVERLGHGLFAVLRANPDLVKFILGD